VTAPGASPRTPWVGLAVSPDPELREAAWPLFAAGVVDAISWSFDTLAQDRLPVWLGALLDAYAAEQRLTLHGVRMSPLSTAQRSGEREAWLACAHAAATRWGHPPTSEHFGFASAGEVVFGAPLPVPFSRAALSAGRASLAQLSAASPAVGLENLALSFSAHDALLHGAFVGALVGEQAEGYLVLDVHNLLCQASSFHLSLDTLLSSYPLERVRELHVAGGRTVTMLPGTRPVRRDTHDAALPADLLACLPGIIARCPNVRAVFLERLPGTLSLPHDQAALQADFHALRACVLGAAAYDAVRAPASSAQAFALIEDDATTLGALQLALLAALRAADDAARARDGLLAQERLAPYHPWLARAELRMLETARELVRRFTRLADGPLG
jgi:uncharacterized protein (UPF0276 family)